MFGIAFHALGIKEYVLVVAGGKSVLVWKDIFDGTHGDALYGSVCLVKCNGGWRFP